MNSTADGHEAVTTRLASAEVAGWRWLDRNLSLFTPDKIETPNDAKALAELAILYGSARILGHAQLENISRALESFLQDQAHCQLLRRLPAYYDAFAPVYFVMRRFGHRFAEWESTLKDLHRMGYPHVIEAVSFRAMERAYFRWTAGLDSRPPTWSRRYSSTGLARYKGPIYLADDEVYAVTHTIFYLTDFGTRLPDLQLTEQNRIRDFLAPLVVYYIRRQHWDLVGEILINLISLEAAKPTDLIYFGLDALLGAWRSDGAMPSSGDRLLDPNDLNGMFRHCYHTTLVATLFATIWRTRCSRSLSNEIQAFKS